MRKKSQKRRSTRRIKHHLRKSFKRKGGGDSKRKRDDFEFNLDFSPPKPKLIQQAKVNLPISPSLKHIAHLMRGPLVDSPVLQKQGVQQSIQDSAQDSAQDSPITSMMKGPLLPDANINETDETDETDETEKRIPTFKTQREREAWNSKLAKLAEFIRLNNRLPKHRRLYEDTLYQWTQTNLHYIAVRNLVQPFLKSNDHTFRDVNIYSALSQQRKPANKMSWDDWFNQFKYFVQTYRRLPTLKEEQPLVDWVKSQFNNKYPQNPEQKQRLVDFIAQFQHFNK